MAASVHAVRLRGLVDGVAVASDPLGDPVQAEVWAEQLVFRWSDGRARALSLARIDGLGVRASECALFLEGGDVLECLGDGAAALSQALTAQCFAVPELLRAARAPEPGQPIAQRVWEGTSGVLLAAARALRGSGAIGATVVAATTAVIEGIERLPLVLLGAPTDTADGRARQARLADALLPVTTALPALRSARDAVQHAPIDELCRHWRAWRMQLEQVAAQLRTQHEAVVEACAPLDGATSARSRWWPGGVTRER